jgi:hypothetical protein
VRQVDETNNSLTSLKQQYTEYDSKTLSEIPQLK